MQSASRSEIVLLPACAGEVAQMPLDVAVLVVEGSSTDLEYPHAEAGSNLTQFDLVIARLYEDVAPRVSFLGLAAWRMGKLTS